MAVKNQPILCGYKEAAEETGLSEWTLRSLVWRGELPVVKIANKHFLHRDDIQKLIERRKVRYASPPNSVSDAERIRRFEAMKRKSEFPKGTL